MNINGSTSKRQESFDTNVNCTKRKELIDEWIFSERDRYILKRKLIDDISMEKIAEEVGLTPRQVQTVITKGKEQISLHI